MDALRLKIDAGDDADLQELEQLTLQLRRHLMASNVDIDSIQASRSQLPSGAKAADPMTAGQLILALVASGGVVTSLISAIQSWLSRRERCSVTIEIDGDKLQINGATDEDRKRAIDIWVERRGHAKR